MTLKQCSREVLFVPNLVTISKPLHLINDEMDDEDLWMTNIVDRYIARPKDETFENMCLADFASKYKVRYSKHSKRSKRSSINDSDDVDECGAKEQSHVHELQDGLGNIVKRKKSAAVRYPHFSKTKDSESYYANLIRMYCPHRNKDIKSDFFNTFEQMFLSEEKVTIENLSRLETLTQDLDDAWQRLQQEEPQEDAWAEIAPNTERDRAEQAEELELLR